MLEQKNEKSRFVRVDADVIDKLILKSDERAVDLTPAQRTILTTLFSSQTPQVDKATFFVSFDALDEKAQPVVVTQNEYMRRMKDMAALQPGMSFYGEMPDSYNLVVNTSSPIIEKLRDIATDALADKIAPSQQTIDSDNSQIEKLRSTASDGKLSAEAEKQVSDLQASVADARSQQEAIIKDFAATQPQVRQLVDIALLAVGLLRGKDLSDFIARSTSLIKF
jgi:molecular chaperone HtpG